VTAPICLDCGAPMVPQRHAGRPPEGHKKAGAHGRCKTCYLKHLRGGWAKSKDEQSTPTMAPERLTELHHQNNIAGLEGYLANRRTRLARTQKTSA
jgi:hypothetical protein